MMGASKGSGGGSSCFYVIEDDPDHQKIAEMTLQAAGISDIMLFSTGEEAMDFFTASGPAAEAVILIDLMLPNIGGLEILQRLRKDSRWGSCHMVVLTCSTSSADRSRSQELGADDFQSKPLSLEYVQKILSSDR
jgi:two-component system alkaline phosphatase synthesis response regulator PhoP